MQAPYQQGLAGGTKGGERRGAGAERHDSGGQEKKKGEVGVTVLFVSPGFWASGLHVCPSPPWASLGECTAPAQEEGRCVSSSPSHARVLAARLS